MLEPFAPWLRDLNRVFTGEGTGASFVPRADVLVSDDGVSVVLDVPGVTAEELQVELENDTLLVSGERAYPYGESDAGVRRIERGFGRFQRSLRVPRGLDPDAVQASLVNGVLTLRIPTREQPKPRRIAIKATTPQTESGAGEGQAG